MDSNLERVVFFEKRRVLFQARAGFSLRMQEWNLSKAITCIYNELLCTCWGSECFTLVWMTLSFNKYCKLKDGLQNFLVQCTYSRDGCSVKRFFWLKMYCIFMFAFLKLVQKYRKHPNFLYSVQLPSMIVQYLSPWDFNSWK